MHIINSTSGTALYNSDLCVNNYDNWSMKTNTSIQIGTRIRHFRELAGLTQLQLSELIPCEPSTIAHYETGKNLVSMTKLIRIAEVLEVELYQFFITSPIDSDIETIDKLNKLLSTVNKVQLNLIYNIVSSVLELSVPKK